MTDRQTDRGKYMPLSMVCMNLAHWGQCCDKQSRGERVRSTGTRKTDWKHGPGDTEHKNQMRTVTKSPKRHPVCLSVRLSVHRHILKWPLPPQKHKKLQVLCTTGHHSTSNLSSENVMIRSDLISNLNPICLKSNCQTLNNVLQLI